MPGDRMSPPAAGLPSKVAHDSSRRTVMNTLKNVLFFGLLLAVLCGVYLSLNHQQEAPLPPGLTATTTSPTVVVPGLTGPPLLKTGSSPESSSPPDFPSQPPSLSAFPSTGGGGIAPPFQPPGSANSAGAAPPRVFGDAASSPTP